MKQWPDNNVATAILADIYEGTTMDMVTVLEILLGVAAVILLIPVSVLFAEVLFARPGSRSAAAQDGERQRLTVVMPAHNEASVIASTLRSLTTQLRKTDRLVVVADNCSDETAAIAAAEGAEVILRNDSNRRGKAYAVDFAIRHLESDPPDVVMIVDADCEVSVGAIEKLVQMCTRTARPVQALYLMQASKNAGLKMRIAEFAWAVRNQVRPAGLLRMGLPCQLMGSGTAFPWSGISSVKIANGHLAEDYKLGIDLACAGTPPLFCPDALVTSNFPTSNSGALGQRTRWEHGHIALVLRDAPRLFLHGLATMNLSLMALALDLFVPPLALLTIQVVVIWLASALLYKLTLAQFPLDAATLAAMLLGVSVLLSWRRFGRSILSLGSLALVMVYTFWKIPLYARFLVARQRVWLRTRRDDEA
jgi:cellulose synthase/poly-beta-1,6-N-acetylglucosamine synthase-like glycosyltransferase